MNSIRIVSSVVVALVLGALAPAIASASYVQATEYEAEVKGEKEGGAHTFTLEGGTLSVQCEKATFAGELPIPEEEEEVLPSFESCTASGSAASVNMEGCKFRLNANTTDVDVVCPAGKAIKIVAAFETCEVQIGSQNNVEKAEFINNEVSPKTVSVKANATGIKYTKTKDGFFCPLSGVGEKSDGTYVGNTLMKAFHGAQVGLFVGAAVVTRVCKEKEKAACPEAQTYQKGTIIKGQANLPRIVTGGYTIECEKAVFAGELLAAEGKPYLSTTAGHAFTNCEFVVGGKGKCNVTMSGGTSRFITAVGDKKDGRWTLQSTVLTISGCEDKGYNQAYCEYSASPRLKIRGNSAGMATIEAEQTFGDKKGPFGNNCPLTAVWNEIYAISEPAGLWVTN